MRLWSISPRYLDRQGLIALWREALLAQNVLLKGEFSECQKCNGTGVSEPGIKFGVACSKCEGMGKIKTPYYNHPQLKRFKVNKDLSLYRITAYLYVIYEEGIKRGYKFDKDKIRLAKQATVMMPVTRGQLIYEFNHLQDKLFKRDRKKEQENFGLIGNFKGDKIEAHPLFTVVEGGVEEWEVVK